MKYKFNFLCLKKNPITFEQECRNTSSMDHIRICEYAMDAVQVDIYIYKLKFSYNTQSYQRKQKWHLQKP